MKNVYFIIVILLVLIMSPTLFGKEFTPPNADNGKTIVSMQVFIIDVDTINAADQSFTANVYYEVHWRDPRLIPATGKKYTISLHDAWNPRIQILNQQRVWATFPHLLTVDSKGNVSYKQRVWGAFSQPLMLHNFPFDKQTFNIWFIAATTNYDSIRLVKNPNLRSGLGQGFSLPDWKILNWGLSNRLYPGLEQQNENIILDFYFEAERYIAYYLLKYGLPLALIVIMSWIVFWVKVSDVAIRINISLTTILTLIAYRFIIGSTLPIVAYLTVMDKFILTGTLLVFSTLLIVMLTSKIQKHHPKAARLININCRWLFPLLSIIFMLPPFLNH